MSYSGSSARSFRAAKEPTCKATTNTAMIEARATLRGGAACLTAVPDRSRHARGGLRWQLAERRVASLGTHTGPGNPGDELVRGRLGEGREGSPGSQAIAYSACMRSHGVPNFPDPQIHHTPTEPACGWWSRRDHHGQPRSSSPPSRPAASCCPTAVGLDTPAGDPAGTDAVPEGGGVHPLPRRARTSPTRRSQAAACTSTHQGLNESSPAFKSAVQACESLIPGGAHGGSGSLSSEAAPHAAP